MGASSAPKRNAEAAGTTDDGAETASKKQIDEDPQTATQANEDEPCEKQGKGSTFKELPYVFLSDGSKHLEQAM
jgi:hypothetical protein